jgi:hypothetical protein
MMVVHVFPAVVDLSCAWLCTWKQGRSTQLAFDNSPDDFAPARWFEDVAVQADVFSLQQFTTPSRLDRAS